MTLSVSNFSSPKIARSQFSSPPQSSLPSLKPVQFGSTAVSGQDDDAPKLTTWGFFKSVGKELVKSPLPLWRRPLAFLNPKNWIAGFQEAKKTFGESKHKVLESLGLAIDIGLSFMSFKVLFVLNALFPNFMITNTGKAFFRGVHQASADKLVKAAE